MINEPQNASIPEWMVETCTVFIQKDPTKGNAIGNCRPIACLNLLWKLLTSITTDKLHEHLKNQDLLPEYQKGCRQRSHSTKDQLLILQTVIKTLIEGKTTSKWPRLISGRFTTWSHIHE